MIARSLKLPKGSCFLFGPRGTGKSTWVNTVLPKALRIDLLKESTFTEVTRSSVFRESDLAGLRLFCTDYPQARGHLFYGGTRRYRFGAIEVVPLAEGLSELAGTLA